MSIVGIVFKNSIFRNVPIDIGNIILRETRYKFRKTTAVVLNA